MKRDSAAIAAAKAVDQERLWQRLMTMAGHGATPAGGVNRQALSQEDAAARRLMLDWARDLGLKAETDAIGNLFLTLPGTEVDANPVLTGSHLDSQPMGGKFDGAYGVLAGLEALQAIKEAQVETRRPVQVVAWTNEEGSRFAPGMVGSSVFAGKVAIDRVLLTRDNAGLSVADALETFLAATPEVPLRKASIMPAAYVEAHIEQGPLLEHEGLSIGLVTGVQGISWFEIEVLGEAAHAGTTPLKDRKDALKAAVAMAGALETLMADETDTLRFTIGRFEVEPGSPNTVPARVLFTIDFRHPEQAVIEQRCGQIESVCRANARGCAVSVRQTAEEAPTLFDPAVMRAIRAAAEDLKLDFLEMPSGAGHDAMNLAAVAPTGMIFVPCERGVSHNEAENARPADLADGARVLAASLVALANT